MDAEGVFDFAVLAGIRGRPFILWFFRYSWVCSSVNLSTAVILDTAVQPSAAAPVLGSSLYLL